MQQLIVSAYYQAVNQSIAAILAGQAVALHSSGAGFVLASALGIATALSGLLIDDADPAENGTVVTSSPIALSDWTASAGAPTLVANATYFLSTTAGRITAVPPSAAGQIVQIVGYAVNPTTLNLRISQPILL